MATLGLRVAVIAGAAALSGILRVGAAHADNLYVSNSSIGTIGKYTTAGTAVNPALVSDLGYADDVALDGNGYLYVVDNGRGVIGKYTTSGTPVNTALISGLYEPAGDDPYQALRRLCPGGRVLGGAHKPPSASGGGGLSPVASRGKEHIVTHAPDVLPRGVLGARSLE